MFMTLCYLGMCGFNKVCWEIEFGKFFFYHSLTDVFHVRVHNFDYWFVKGVWYIFFIIKSPINLWLNDLLLWFEHLLKPLLVFSKAYVSSCYCFDKYIMVSKKCFSTLQGWNSSSSFSTIYHPGQWLFPWHLLVSQSVGSQSGHHQFKTEKSLLGNWRRSLILLSYSHMSQRSSIATIALEARVLFSNAILYVLFSFSMKLIINRPQDNNFSNGVTVWTWVNI